MIRNRRFRRFFFNGQEICDKINYNKFIKEN